ncbi:DUF2083 domain-containing protein [Hydrogenophaga sp. YM1]|uniref:helix-turn-helix domain-containing protein n=1 Tax=Hydrogenophaga sp. YM1 TaxID=2806262 RepID=UPI00195837C5|nr:short-chain fatty acyl-CoA regulator family protein [Hydrogenophaga sp. YM1]QRR33493.1 DUF2083 domain-containing protein [Hydrogenophaga sp. YM1]
MPRTLVGPKIRDRRKALGLTQAGLAHSIGISASYLNLIESSRRPIAGALLKRVADALSVPVDDFDRAAERRLIDDLGEAAADPAIASRAPDPASAADLAAGHPEWAQALVSLHRSLRDSRQAAAALSDRLNQDPFLGDAVHRLLTRVTAIRSACEIMADQGELDAAQRSRFLAIIGDDSRRLAEVASALADFFEPSRVSARSLTPMDDVDDFIAEHDSHFPALEDAALALRAAVGGPDSDIERRLVRYLQRMHGVQVVFAAEPPANAAHARHGTWFDAHARRCTLLEVLPGTTRRFELARLAAQLASGEAIDALLDASLQTDAARRGARRALGAYTAAAVLMPYDAFLAAARRTRYDIDHLCRRFDASFEQVCHRLVTLRRPGAQGVRFGFMRADPAGHMTKRFPLPGMPLPRYGNACPLWAVYKAFQTPGVLERQLVEFPNAQRFLLLARAVEKPRLTWQVPRRFVSVMLSCDALQADQMVYADGLNLSSAAPAVPVGQTCRLCLRPGCDWREEEPIIHAGIDSISTDAGSA